MVITTVKLACTEEVAYCSAIFINENENGVKRKNNKFINEN